MKAEKQPTTDPSQQLPASPDELLSQLKDKEQEIHKKNLLIKEKDKEIQNLRMHLAYLIRQKFGQKSERYIDTNQLTLFQMQELLTREEIEQDQPAQEEKPAEAPKPKNKPKREALPSHLPRVREVIEPENLPLGAKKIGEEVTEKLEYTPGKFWVRSIVRPKYVVPQQDGVLIASLPDFAIDKAIAGVTLLAHLLVGKYVDHLPFYRMIGIFKRAKVDLSEVTVNNWFVKVIELLEPLYQELKKQTLQSAYIQADETTIRVQTEKKGATHQGYMWVYHAPRKGTLFFEYHPTRACTAPSQGLAEFSGALQTDGYAAYDNLPNKEKITRLACMAHARRYFEKAKDEDPQGAGYVLGQIQRLYAIERQIQESTSQQRYEIRQSQAVPILAQMKEWLEKKRNSLLPQSHMGKAFAYTLKLWDRLCAYTTNGDYHIDNNPIENKIRPIALGRKNYLFAGNHDAAQRTAIIYTLMAACKINNIDPVLWLTDILDRIPGYKFKDIAELLPAQWKATH